MPFNIEEFKANINAGGLARSSNYEIQITRPRFEGDTSTDISRDIVFRCEQVDIPGRRVATADIRYAGTLRRFGYDVLPTPVAMQFILSEDMREKVYFEEWQDAMIGKHRTGYTGDDMFDLGYYDDYVGTVIIRQYNEIGSVVYETKLLEAYPMEVNGVTASWLSGEQILRQNVLISYRHYIDTIIKG